MSLDVVDSVGKLIEINDEYPAITSFLIIAIVFMIVMWWINIRPIDKGLLIITPKYQKFRRKCYFVSVCVISLDVYALFLYVRDHGVELNSFGILIGAFVLKILSLSLVAAHVPSVLRRFGYILFIDKLSLYLQIGLVYASGIMLFLSGPIFTDTIISPLVVALFDSLALDYMKWERCEGKSRFYCNDDDGRTYVYTVSDDLQTAICGNNIFQSYATKHSMISTENVKMLPTCAVAFDHYFSSFRMLLQGLMHKSEIILRNPTEFDLKHVTVDTGFWKKNKLVHNERCEIEDWKSNGQYSLVISSRWKKYQMTLKLVDLEIE